MILTLGLELWNEKVEHKYSNIIEANRSYKYIIKFNKISNELSKLKTYGYIYTEKIISESHRLSIKSIIQQKQLLIREVFEKNLSIRQSAKKLGLNDSTAKVLIRKYKKQYKIEPGISENKIRLPCPPNL